MTRSITIETQSDADFALLQELAHRMGLHTVDRSLTNGSHDEQREALTKFTGSWQGDESVYELEAIIYGARHEQPRDIDL